MRKRWVYAIQVALSLVIITALAIGCEGSLPTSTPGSVTAPPSKSTPTPPASEYPADISGRVTIAEKVRCNSFKPISPNYPVPPNRDPDVFWIVDISVKNNTYSDPVKADFLMGYKGWVISANDKEYIPRVGGSPGDNPPIDLTIGQTGKFMFYRTMPKTLQISDAQICYKGQEPYSYGKLTGGDKVAAYDWDLKTAIEETKESSPLWEGILNTTSRGNWKFTLIECTIRQTTIDIKCLITLVSNKPYNYSVQDIGELVCVDQYGIMFANNELEQTIHRHLFYPDDSVSVNARFVVNQKSGVVSLWLYKNRMPGVGIYSKDGKAKLVDLGEVK